MILALDLSTRKTGYCAGTGECVPTADAFVLPQTGEDIGQMLALLDDNLSALLERFKPSVVVYEAPILPQGPGRSTLLIRRKLFSLGSHVEFVCYRRGIRCGEETVKAIKKELGGSSKASKDDMVAAAEKCGVRLPETIAGGREDAADAFGIWLLALRHTNPQLSARWDRVLYSSRGALL